MKRTPIKDRVCPSCKKKKGTSFGLYYEGGTDELGYCKNCKQFILIIDDKNNNISQELSYIIEKALKDRYKNGFGTYPKKQILIYSDDFNEFGQKHIQTSNSNYCIKFISNRTKLWKEKLNNYDAILIDYGILGDDRHLIRKLAKCLCQLAWYGALADMVNQDAKKMYPEEIRFHSLPSANINEIEWLLDEVLFKDDNKKVD